MGVGFLNDMGHIAGSFLTDIVGGAAVRAKAAETDIRSAASRMHEATEAAHAWSASDIARVLVASDPLTLVGRGDAGRLYLGVAVAIVQATMAGDRSARAIRKGFEAGIDGLPEGVRIFTKRRAVRTVSDALAQMARLLGSEEDPDRGTEE